MIRIATAALLAGLAGGLTPVLAQKVVPGPDSDAVQAPRYRFSHTADGVMRLDSQTGQVTLCKPRDGTFVCNPAPEESAQLKVELKQKNDQFDKLKTEIGQLQEQIAAPKSDVAAPAVEPEAVKDDIAALKAALAAKTAQIGKLSDDIAQLKSQLADAKPGAPGADTATLKGDVATLKIEIDNLKQKLGALGKDAIGQDERHDLVTRIDGLEQNTGGMAGALSRLEKQSADLQKKIDAQGKTVQQQIAAIPAPPDLKPDMSRLDQENTALKGEVSTLSADLATLKDRVAALAKAQTTQDQVAVQRSQIEQLAMENATLKDQVASLKSQTSALQQKLAALAPPPAAPPRPPADVPAGRNQTLNLPSAEDIARAKAALAEAWRRMVDMIDQLRHDMTRKDDDSVRL